jgi:predicted nuclease of predicted toxin-antitoxin system
VPENCTRLHVTAPGLTAGRVFKSRPPRQDSQSRSACTSDEDVLALAFASGAVLLTEDTDFGELAVRLGRQHFGILLLRLPGARTEEKLAAVKDAIPALERREFVVKKGDRMRTR